MPNITHLTNLKEIFQFNVPTNYQKELPLNCLQIHTLKKNPPYRNPSPYIVSVLTMLSDLGANIEINMRTFYYSIISSILINCSNQRFNSESIKQFLPGILDIQYLSYSCGESTFMETKNKSKRKKTFNNGCTMRICLNGDKLNIINVKLFNNGRMHFTGLKDKDNAIKCVNIVKDRVDHLIKLSTVHSQIIDFCGYGCPSLIINNIKRIEKISSQPCSRLYNNFVSVMKSSPKILMILITHIPQKDIHALSKSCKFFYNLLHSNNHKFWKYALDSVPDNNRYIMCLNKKYMHLEIGQNLTTINQLKMVKPEKLKNLYLGNLQDYRPIVVHSHQTQPKTHYSNETIEMINSNFKTHFSINQRKLTKMLQEDYPYMNTSYEPDDKYHGIKIYWPHPDTVSENGDDSSTVNIFISIFRTGSVLMSGAKNYKQLNDTYIFINDILKKYYDKIWIE